MTLNRTSQVLLVLPAACAALTTATMLYLSGVLDPSFRAEARSGPELVEAAGLSIFGAVEMAYNLLAPFALAVLIVVGARRYPKGLLVIAAASVASTAATVYALFSVVFDESSTAVLLLLFLPVYLGFLLVPFGLGAALVHRFRSRTRSGRKSDAHSARPA